MDAIETLLRNIPFWMLGVSLDDNMDAIEDRVDELEDDDLDTDWKGVAQRLRKPQERIRCEVAWLPGLDPDEAAGKVDAILSNKNVALETHTAPNENISALADTNLRVMRLVASRKGRADIAGQLIGIAEAWERVDASDVAKQINGHRARAGLRSQATDEKVYAALEDHKAWLNATVQGEIEQSPATMVATMLAISEATTDNGRLRAPEAVRDWVSFYERKHKQFFVHQKTAMEMLQKNALAALKRKDKEKATKITQNFCHALRAWDRIAQPIQIIHQGDGRCDLETERTFEIARDFSLSLHNEYGETALAAEVVETQRQVFKEAERLEQHLEQDEKTLADIIRQQKNMEENTRQIEPFSAKIGVVLKTLVEVTDDHIRVGNKTVHPDKVWGLRWGGVMLNVGASYEIWVAGEGQQVLHASTRRANVYEQMTQRLMEGCGLRLVWKLFKILDKGKSSKVGNCTFKDGSIRLMRRHWFKSDEAFWAPWQDTQMDVDNGQVKIKSVDGCGKADVSFSLRDDWNGVVLLTLLTARQHNGVSRLSDCFRSGA